MLCLPYQIPRDFKIENSVNDNLHFATARLIRFSIQIAKIYSTSIRQRWVARKVGSSLSVLARRRVLAQLSSPFGRGEARIAQSNRCDVVNSGNKNLSRGNTKPNIVGDDRGAVTVSFVLWMPFFLMLVMVIADVAVLFTTNATMWDSARDAARRLALHQITEDQAEQYVLEHIVIGKSSDYQVAAVDGDDVVVQVVTSTSNASVFGIFGEVLPGELVARVTMLREPE